MMIEIVNNQINDKNNEEKDPLQLEYQSIQHTQLTLK